MHSIEHIISILEKHASIISEEELDILKELQAALLDNLAAAREEGRNLRIAVVGQMKAGKSSFLNAAFFGRDLLPRADTPMTAALTRIVYSARPRAEVMFYTEDDWAGIMGRHVEYERCYKEIEQQLLAASGASPFAAPCPPAIHEVESRLPSGLKASHELVTRAKSCRLDVASYLGRTHELESTGGSNTLARDLCEYVGSDGRFTAITKMLVLHVDDPRLEGLELIDTPGFNDPVVSRGQITRTYLGRCDVILLLSAVSQFLTSADMAVLREQLPEAGIDDKAVFLLGSQRDLALRQDREIAAAADRLVERIPSEQRQEARVAAMIQLLDKRMTEHARRTLNEQIIQSGQDEKTRRILEAIKHSAPYFLSAWAWLVAEQFSSLTENDRYHLDQLERAIGYPLDMESLHQLSNIPALRDLVLGQRKRKEELLLSKEQALVEGARSGIHNQLQRIQNSLVRRDMLIRRSSLPSLEKTEQEMLKRIREGRRSLELIFSKQAHAAQEKLLRLKPDVQARSQRALHVDSHRDIRNETYEVSTSRWYNPFSWGTTETRSREVVTIYASVQDAIEQIQDLALKTTRSLQREISRCIDLDDLRKELSTATRAFFSPDDADVLLAGVEGSLRHMTLPDVSLSERDYSKSLVRTFGRERVDEDQIENLRRVQQQAVAAVLDDLNKELQMRITAIRKGLEEVGQSFVDDMIHDIQQELSQLRADIAHKEQTLHEIDKARQAIGRLLSSSETV